MHVTRGNEAKGYEAALHHGCAAFRLQGAEASPIPGFWVGLSHFLPDGGAEWDATNAHKVYVVLDGEITVENEHERVVLKPGDSVLLGAGERRRVVNETNEPASMLVIVAPAG